MSICKEVRQLDLAKKEGRLGFYTARVPIAALPFFRDVTLVPLLLPPTARQRIALDTLTPDRSAARRHERSSSTENRQARILRYAQPPPDLH